VLHTEVRIVRPDGSDAAVGELGELWVKGPNVTPGYWNKPDANASSFTDGWLHTVDATRVDEDGFYYIVDRWKDMYISGRRRTSIRPRSRACCISSIAVAEAAIIGIPNEHGGEVGMAIIALKPGHTLAREEIHAHCAANLARFKCPRLIEFVDALPRNATGRSTNPLAKDFLYAEGYRYQRHRLVTVCRDRLRFSPLSPQQKTRGTHFHEQQEIFVVGRPAVLCLLFTQVSTPALAQKKYDTGASDTEIKIGNVRPIAGRLPPMASSARPRKPISR